MEKAAAASATGSSAAQSTTGNTAKAAHYHASLSAALLKGAWGDSKPGAEPNGTEISWTELIRKWGKHTGGNTALVYLLRDISLVYLSARSQASASSSADARKAYVTVGSNTAATSSQPTVATANTTGGQGSSSSSAEGSGSGTGSFIHVPHPHLPHRHHREAASTSSTTGPAGPAPGPTYLSMADLDGDVAAGGAEWAEGMGWWSGIGLEHVDEAREGVRALEALIAGGKLRLGEMQSAQLTLAYYQYALGQHDASLRIYNEFDWASDPRLGVVEGDAAVVERIRGRCLQGISAEVVGSSDPSVAYRSAVRLLQAMPSLPVAVPPYLASGATPKMPFEGYRELHRSISSALVRAAVLSSRRDNQVTETLRVLRTYHTISQSWPGQFRPRERQRMLIFHLRALACDIPAPRSASAEPHTLLDGPNAPTGLAARFVWRKEALEIVRLGRGLLGATTAFPRAGEVNEPVRRFVDVCVALADRNASLTREVVNTLWWAMNLTFQSQAILRHLTRLLVRLGDYADARRTFELYVQLVLKARETQQPETALQLKRRLTDDAAGTIAAASETLLDDGTAQDDDDLGLHSPSSEENEMDRDVDFVHALLVGAKLIAHELGEATEAWRYASLAGDVLKTAEETGKALGTKIRAEVEQCKGAVRIAMSMQGPDPLNRATYQAQAINHLTSATTLWTSSPEAFYHLAFCQAEARSIAAAKESIHTALELDSTNIQSWHLLALLLTSQQNWSGAAKACEAGVSVWETHEAEDEADDDEDEDPAAAGVEAKDFAIANRSTILLSPSAAAAPSPPLLRTSGIFAPLPKSSPIRPSRQARLEHVIRLRMTQNVIVEKTQGPEAAMLRQQELFALFSSRSGKNRGRAAAVPGNTGLRDSAGASLASVPAMLDGSYISVPGDGAPAPVNVLPPTPVEPDTAQFTLASPVGGSRPGSTARGPLHSATTSPGTSTPVSSAGHSADGDAEEVLDSPRSSVVGEPKAEKKKGLAGMRKLPKHLHVPGSHGHKSITRPSSIRRLNSASELHLPVERSRVASASSAAISLAPTAVHSHYHGAPAHAAPPPPPMQQPDHGRTPAESRILSNLWLQSAATFRRWSKPEQALVAIEEAEVLDPENGEVWVQLGLYHLANGVGPSPNYEAAKQAFTKAVLLRPDHPSAIVLLGKLYLDTGEIEMAHTMLNQVTQDAGWDVAEAWYYLGRVCERQGREARAGECYRYALELEERRPARRWREAVSAWL